jgi:hypothetical protein
MTYIAAREVIRRAESRVARCADGSGLATTRQSSDENITHTHAGHVFLSDAPKPAEVAVAVIVVSTNENGVECHP